MGEAFDGAVHAIPTHPAQFDQIVRSRQCDQQSAVVAYYAPKFRGIHPRSNRHDDRKRRLFVRHETIGIGYDPLASGIPPGCGVYGRNRNIHSMHIKAAKLGERAGIKPVTAAGIQQNVSSPHIEDLANSMQQRSRHTKIVQPPARGNGLRGIAGIF